MVVICTYNESKLMNFHKFSGWLDCLHCVQTEHFPYPEDFVKVNSSLELLSCNALSKTCIYYSHTINECPEVHSFKVLSSMFCFCFLKPNMEFT